tara:strand:+ start:678 stop:911 length:234 start_codon:yes stop_codon:yes gene_type:complete
MKKLKIKKFILVNIKKTLFIKKEINKVAVIPKKRPTYVLLGLKFLKIFVFPNQDPAKYEKESNKITIKIKYNKTILS